MLPMTANWRRWIGLHSMVGPGIEEDKFAFSEGMTAAMRRALHALQTAQTKRRRRHQRRRCCPAK